jgi:mannosyl-3-phosphoglycerate phosphatase
MLIVFSDLDGSLLDHDTYDWRPAAPALDALKARGVPVVLVSSKTLAELEGYRAELGLADPVVAENGAATDIPAGYFDDSASVTDGEVSRADLQSLYTALKQQHSFDCRAFFELGVDGIVRETGLSEAQANLANDREASEPILWLDTDERARQFEQEVTSRGLRCTRGGRFLHLMGDTGKEEAVRRLLGAYARQYPGTELTSVSLGDGPNDLGMLASTDIAVIIPGRHDHPMTLESNNRILRPSEPGPAGWNEAILDILADEPDNATTAHSNGA